MIPGEGSASNTVAQFVAFSLPSNLVELILETRCTCGLVSRGPPCWGEIARSSSLPAVWTHRWLAWFPCSRTPDELGGRLLRKGKFVSPEGAKFYVWEGLQGFAVFGEGKGGGGWGECAARDSQQVGMGNHQEGC